MEDFFFIYWFIYLKSVILFLSIFKLLPIERKFRFLYLPGEFLN